MTSSIREHLENHPQVEKFARNMGLRTTHVVDLMARLARTLQDHQDDIEKAHAEVRGALEEARQHPTGRAAQRSPYGPQGRR